jgi:hypothetical protein
MSPATSDRKRTPSSNGVSWTKSAGTADVSHRLVGVEPGSPMVLNDHVCGPANGSPAASRPETSVAVSSVSGGSGWEATNDNVRVGRS